MTGTPCQRAAGCVLLWAGYQILSFHAWPFTWVYFYTTALGHGITSPRFVFMHQRIRMAVRHTDFDHAALVCEYPHNSPISRRGTTGKNGQERHGTRWGRWRSLWRRGAEPAAPSSAWEPGDAASIPIPALGSTEPQSLVPRLHPQQPDGKIPNGTPQENPKRDPQDFPPRESSRASPAPGRSGQSGGACVTYVTLCKERLLPTGSRGRAARREGKASFPCWNESLPVEICTILIPGTSL